MPIKSKQEAAAATSGGVSLLPEAFVEGGGLYDDFDGKVLEASFVEFDYNGSIDEPVLALALEIFNEEADPEDSKAVDGNDPKNPFIQYFSAGSLDHFVPSEDGKEAVPVGSKTGLSKSTNAYTFLMSVYASGFDKSKVTNRVSFLENERFHFKRVKQQDRNIDDDNKGKGKKVGAGAKADDKKKREKEVLCAERYLGGAAAAATSKPGVGATAAARPGGPPKKPGGPPPKPNGAAAAAVASTPDETVAAWTAAYIIDKATEAGGSHPHQGLAKDVTTWAAEHIKAGNLDIPTRNKIIKALGDQAWIAGYGEELIAAGEPGWVFDGETITLA